MIGKNAKLTPESNDEVRAAMDSGKPVRSFADLLHDMTVDAETVVAVGSYGKSTCTALLAWCLKAANKDPSYFIGEITNGFATHAHRGRGTTFVLEGDEYPASNWDDTLEIPALQRQERAADVGDPRPHQRVSDARGLSARRFARCSARCRPTGCWSPTAASRMRARLPTISPARSSSMRWTTRRTGMPTTSRAARKPVSI